MITTYSKDLLTNLLQDDQVILLNEDLLKIYGADRWSHGTTQTPTPPVKAGDIIIAARPFVYALATSSRGRR